MTGPELIELRPTAMAAGGEAVAREPSGRVVFVRGALPGEAVVARMVEERDRYARAVVERVDDPSPGRVEPPCPYVAAGCGGCSWQHIAPAEQRALKRQIADDALTRAGGVAGAVVVDGPELPTDGLPHHRPAGGHRRPGRVPPAALHDVVPVDACLVAHPALASLIADARFPGADEVVLRCSAATGERLVRVLPEDAAAAAELPPDVLARPGRVAAPRRSPAGRCASRPARSSRPGPTAPRRWSPPWRRRPATTPIGRTVVDAYAGVGLFSACLPVTGRVVAVESSASSCRRRRGQPGAPGRRGHPRRRGPLAPGAGRARWSPTRRGPASARPRPTGWPRTGAARIVLVSCDPASLGRDAALLDSRLPPRRSRRSSTCSRTPPTSRS